MRSSIQGNYEVTGSRFCISKLAAWRIVRRRKPAVCSRTAKGLTGDTERLIAKILTLHADMSQGR
jgi:hypothetical protein